MDDIRKITTELAKIEDGKVKAIADGDKVYLMIQDAPAELRRLADALEKIDVREIRALVAYVRPTARKTSARTPKPIVSVGSEVALPVAAVDARLQALVSRLRGSLGPLELASFKDGVVSLRLPGATPRQLEEARDEVRAAFEKELPEVARVELS